MPLLGFPDIFTVERIRDTGRRSDLDERGDREQDLRVAPDGSFTARDEVSIPSLGLTGMVIEHTGGPFAYYTGNLRVYSVLISGTREVRFFPQDLLTLLD